MGDNVKILAAIAPLGHSLSFPFPPCGPNPGSSFSSLSSRLERLKMQREEGGEKGRMVRREGGRQCKNFGSNRPPRTLTQFSLPPPRTKPRQLLLLLVLAPGAILDAERGGGGERKDGEKGGRATMAKFRQQSPPFQNSLSFPFPLPRTKPRQLLLLLLLAPAAI